VVKTSGLDQHGIGVDFFGGFFGQGGDNQRMMVGAGSFQGQLPENRQVGIGQLVQLGGCQEPEDGFKNRNENKGDGRTDQPAKKWRL